MKERSDFTFAQQNLGRIAYNGWCDQARWKSPETGEDLPMWCDLPDIVQVCWMCSAHLVKVVVDGRKIKKPIVAV